MKRLSPQHRQILSIHADGRFHCSTEIEFIRDQRRRVTDLQDDFGYRFESVPCRMHAHRSRTLCMRRLVSAPEVEGCCAYHLKVFGTHAPDCPMKVTEAFRDREREKVNALF